MGAGRLEHGTCRTSQPPICGSSKPARLRRQGSRISGLRACLTIEHLEGTAAGLEPMTLCRRCENGVLVNQDGVSGTRTISSVTLTALAELPSRPGGTRPTSPQLVWPSADLHHRFHLSLANLINAFIIAKLQKHISSSLELCRMPPCLTLS